MRIQRKRNRRIYRKKACCAHCAHKNPSRSHKYKQK